MKMLVKALVRVLFFLCGLCAHGEQLKLDLPPEVITQIARGHGGKNFEGSETAVLDFANWKREPYNIAVVGGCHSHHDATPNIYNEINPCLGVIVWSPGEPDDCRAFGQYLYVKRNSLGGVSRSQGFGVECLIAPGVVDLYVALKRAKLHYEDPGTIRKRKPAHLDNWVTTPSITFVRGSFGFMVDGLGKNAYMMSMYYKFHLLPW